MQCVCCGFNFYLCSKILFWFKIMNSVYIFKIGLKIQLSKKGFNFWGRIRKKGVQYFWGALKIKQTNKQTNKQRHLSYCLSLPTVPLFLLLPITSHHSLDFILILTFSLCCAPLWLEPETFRSAVLSSYHSSTENLL